MKIIRKEYIVKNRLINKDVKYLPLGYTMCSYVYPLYDYKNQYLQSSRELYDLIQGISTRVKSEPVQCVKAQG